LRRLALICHASTRATRLAAFPADEPIEPNALDDASLPSRLSKAAYCWTSPALRARQTAEALGLLAVVEPLMSDCDFGRWTGRPILDVERDEPDALAQWLADPAATPHGGESIVALIERAGAWLVRLGGLSGQIVAVTHQSVIRAVIVQALGAPPLAFWRVDVPPLAIIELKHNGQRWTLVFQSGR
jgi:broad specificity phosphatase PhoE